MVLVVGATGQLGVRIARELLERQVKVRALVRHPERLDDLQKLGAELVEGDLLHRESVERALEGCTQVITTANGGGLPPARHVVDRDGNFNLIDAASLAGVRRFVYLSAAQAHPQSSVDVFRWKWETEEHLRASGLEYTIVRPTHLMETWIELIGHSALQRRVMLFGRGSNPISFVAGADVVRIVVSAIDSVHASNASFEVGGPQAVSMSDLVAEFERLTGKRIRRQRLPLWVVAALRPLLRLWQPVLARQMGFAILIESTDQVSRDQTVWELFPGPRTEVRQFVADWLQRRGNQPPVSDGVTRAAVPSA